jgi:hypothetical protein
MALLADYFEKNRPQAKFDHGDRVYGFYNKVPFAGTVGADIMVNEDIGPLVTVFLDLPIKISNNWHVTFIKVKHKDIKGYLKELSV